MGYLSQERSAHDRRSVTVRLTDKAKAIVHDIRELEDRLAASLSDAPIDDQGVDTTLIMLRRLERTWADYIRYGRD